MSEPQQYRLEQLDPSKHRREDFKCESSELTEFLQKRARKEMQARASACFVLVPEADPGRIAGYYTLSQTAVVVQQLPESLIKKLPRYPQLGATLIGRLARDIEWKGQQLGRLLLIDALRRCVRHSAEVGAVVVVTDPKDEKARKFYADHGFLALDEHRMFLPMSDLVEREANGWNV
ncbi:MAG TPA: GNAT family N-acetyltransferase [Verrucomicrobiae bacterium]|nr:GNAT family N-acetyltransferase [Verrucomicrobiae bacterium]